MAAPGGEKMNVDDRVRQNLEAYFDGELGVLRRAWWTRRIGGSLELRNELAAIEARSRALRDHEREAVGARDSLWTEISMGLPAVDARASAVAIPRARGFFGPPLVAAAVGMAAAVLWLWQPAPGSERVGSSSVSAPVAGSLRYLDTGGRPVLVVEDDPGVTIIWLMDDDGPGGV